MPIISNSSWNCHTTSIFKKFNILPLYCINNVHISCIVPIRATHFVLLNYFCAMFKSNDEVHMYNTRQKGNLYLNSYRLNLKKFTVHVYGPQLWNSIPVDIRILPTIHIFFKVTRRFSYVLFRL